MSKNTSTYIDRYSLGILLSSFSPIWTLTRMIFALHSIPLYSLLHYGTSYLYLPHLSNLSYPPASLSGISSLSGIRFFIVPLGISIVIPKKFPHHSNLSKICFLCLDYSSTKKRGVPVYDLDPVEGFKKGILHISWAVPYLLVNL